MLNTQLFPFFAAFVPAASALRQDLQRRQLTGGCHERKDRLPKGIYDANLGTPKLLIWAPSTCLPCLAQRCWSCC